MKSGIGNFRRDGAGKPRAGEPVEDRIQLAAFTLDGDHYAIDIMRIKEIINPLPITKVPKAPAFIEGVVHQQRGKQPGRGLFLPVVDMRKRFDRPPAEPTRATKYLIVAVDAAEKATPPSGIPSVGGAGPARDASPAGEGGEAKQRWIVGLIVDSVREVLRVQHSEILPPPAMVLTGEERYFSGMCRPRAEGPIVMIVDLDHLLTPGERSVLGQLGGAP